MLDLPIAFPLLGTIWDVVLGVLMAVFVLSMIIMMAVILMQEGKGGGVAGAFGGMAAETFGVKAGTVNRFTAYVAGFFMLTALLYAGIRASQSQAPVKDLPVAPPADVAPAGGSSGEGAAPPGGSGTTPPGTPPATPPATPPGTPPATPPEGSTPPGTPPAPPPEKPGEGAGR